MQDNQNIDLNLYGGKIGIQYINKSRPKTSHRSNEHYLCRKSELNSLESSSINRFSNINPINFTPKLIKNNNKIVSAMKSLSSKKKNPSSWDKEIPYNLIPRAFKQKKKIRKNTSKRDDINKKYNKSLCRYFNEQVNKLISSKQ